MIAMQTIIDAKKRDPLISWSEWQQYSDLFYFFIWRDIKILYKQTILGFSWAIIRPFFSMVVFSIVFGKLARMPSDGIPYPIFSFAALLPWTYFSTTINGATNSLLGKADIFTKIYFPRILLPLTSVVTPLIDMAISLGILIAMMFFYSIVPGKTCTALPLVMFLMIVSTAGFSLWLSALAVQYRDVKHAVPFLSQILMYAAPVVWPVSLVPDSLRWVYGLYPMVGVIEGFRSGLLNTTPFPWDLMTSGLIGGLIILVTGWIYFRKHEMIFTDIA
ncbi:ABC transporter permease [candidate division KSB1 bacterium]|nr:ABC transporter permease [candidate division KSB1 bacterium]